MVVDKETLKFADEAGVREILIQGFARLSEDMTEMRVEMAGVKATHEELKETRHAIRNEMSEQFGLMRIENERIREQLGAANKKIDELKDELHGRINGVKSDVDQRKGRDAALGWVGSGSGLVGLIAALYAIFKGG